MIYFMQPVGGGAVKIGYSADVDTRRRALEWHYGQPLAILATIEGGRDEEREMHGRFAHLRFGKTEQFRPGPDLMAFIGRPLLVDANPDAVEAMEPASDAVSIITLKGSSAYRDWLAGESRRTHIPAATIVRLGLALWAKENGAKTPPEK